MSIVKDNDTKSPELKASIIESILLCCSYNTTFNLLVITVQKTFRISYHELKNYLFYMIEYGVISYNGQKQEYKIEEGGLDLLNVIKKEKNQGKDNINNITITFENV